MSVCLIVVWTLEPDQEVNLHSQFSLATRCHAKADCIVFAVMEARTLSRSRRPHNLRILEQHPESANPHNGYVP